MPGHSRLARLLQVSCVLQLAVALAWAIGRWPASPLQAVFGALLVPLIAPLVLGLELVVVSRVSRRDPLVPVPSAGQLLAAWAIETAHWFRTFWWRQPFRWRALPDDLAATQAGRQGVVFVHGFMCNRGFWTPWMERLQQLGHPYVAVNLEPVFGPIEAYAATIDEAVERLTQRTGHPPVLVCHSMGGLAARAWWRAFGAAGRVAHIVSIGSPHQGTWMARFSRTDNGRQMRLRSEWVTQLARDEQRKPLPPFTSWYSNCDNVVFPASTSMLPAADNRFVPGRPHVGLAFHPQVMTGTLGLLSSVRQSRQGESVTKSGAVNG